MSDTDLMELRDRLNLVCAVLDVIIGHPNFTNLKSMLSWSGQQILEDYATMRLADLESRPWPKGQKRDGD